MALLMLASYGYKTTQKICYTHSKTWWRFTYSLQSLLRLLYVQEYIKEQFAFYIESMMFLINIFQHEEEPNTNPEF